MSELTAVAPDPVLAASRPSPQHPGGTVAEAAGAEAQLPQDGVTTQDMLVEEVSIDGMCGVY